MSFDDPFGYDGAEKLRAEETAAAALLPCRAALDAGDLHGAIAACLAAGAAPACRFGPHAPFRPLTKLQCGHAQALAEFERWSRRLATSKMPPRILPLLSAARRYRPCTNDSPNPGPLVELLDPAPRVKLLDNGAMRAARAFVRRQPATVEIPGHAPVTFRGNETWLVLAGPVGVGKSVAAGWILGELQGTWHRAVDLCRFRADFDPEEVARDRQAIVVDDLGSEHVGATGYAISIVEDILCGRYDENAVTIITTNLKRADFATRYGSRLVDRIAECGVYVELPGKSLRGAR